MPLQQVDPLSRSLESKWLHMLVIDVANPQEKIFRVYEEPLHEQLVVSSQCWQKSLLIRLVGPYSIAKIHGFLPTTTSQALTNQHIQPIVLLQQAIQQQSPDCLALGCNPRI